MKHNAFTALSLAAALVVAGSAGATGFTVDFETQGYALNEANAWNRPAGDESSIIETNVTFRGTASTKSLSLDTGDGELSYTNDFSDVSVLTMDVCFVAADTDPDTTGFDGKTMVYLNETNNTLRAFTGASGWKTLTGSFSADTWYQLKMEFKGTKVVYSVNGTPVGTNDLAASFSSIQSVGFKGTGFVDNFVGDKAGIPAYVDNNVNATATYDNGSVSVTFSGYDGTIQYIEVEDSTGKKVYLRGDNPTALINVSKLNGNIRSVKAHTQGSLATSCGVTPTASAVAVDTTEQKPQIKITVPNAVSGLYYTPFGPDGKALANSVEILPEADGDPATLSVPAATGDWGVVKFQIVASDEAYTEGQSLPTNN